MTSKLKKAIVNFNRDQFRAINTEMSFGEYLDLCYENPKLLRNSWQTIYDMIMDKGSYTIEEYRKTYVNYKFFDDPDCPIVGLAPMKDALVKFIKGAAGGYGTERRILLLHGPVGSSKSTILRLFKRSMEKYSHTEEGSWYSFKWVNLPTGPDGIYNDPECECPMHEQPLKLLPVDIRGPILFELNKIHEQQTSEEQRSDIYTLKCADELDPLCKKFMTVLLKKYDGDIEKVLENHIRVIRKVYSEADRCGIATFQPKDEKNQDSTELTGDINFRNIGNFGSDSDPRAFNFDGEFCVGNRGIIEFIEALKLDTAFLYDLLGASQEQSIKPKKFAQVSIDEAIWCHSVSGHEPVVYRHNGRIGWDKFEVFYDKFCNDASGLEVIAHDFDKGETIWTPVVEVTRHKWTGRVITTDQKWGSVETTPNHSIYNRDGNTFYPDDKNEVMAVRSISSSNMLEKVDISPLLGDLVVDADGALNEGYTKPVPYSHVRPKKPRFHHSILSQYEANSQEMKSLLTLLVWYATEGHCSENGIVISQANRESLERVQAAVQSISQAEGCIGEGSKNDSAYRLELNSNIMQIVCEKLCGKLSENKRLPDFIFQLPKECVEHIFDELMRTDGTTKCNNDFSQEYKDNFFAYTTVSSILASQVGFLATLLGKDYSIYTETTKSGKTAYKLKYTKGFGLRGGRHDKCECRTHEREVNDVWVYDIECKDVHNFACGVGLVVCHNTNDPEFQKLKSNQYMEAFRDRTTKIDVPYTLRWSEELRILEKDYGPGKVRQHIAPHTLEIAALWSILTRLADDKDGKLSLVEKAELYDGKLLPGWTEDSVKELKDKYPDEGMSSGVSVRYLQDKISNCLANNHDYVNMFMVLNELRDGLENSSLLTNKEQVSRYITCVDLAVKKLTEILKNEVQKALVGDKEAVKRLCTNYIDNVMAYINKNKIKDQITGQDRKPDERLMRQIEEKIQIPDTGCDDFRRQIAAFIGHLAHEGKTFAWDSNPKLRKALEAKLFEDVRDTIKLSALTMSGAAVVDKDLQEKIDAVKTRLVKDFGYNDRSATDVLDFVSGIFSRGDLAEDE